jgi:hypothetical protein
MGVLSQKVITNNAGVLTEVASINTTAGASDAQKLVATNAEGILDATLINSTTTSNGADSAGKVVALGSNGLLDSSMLPAGIGEETVAVTASEALTAGDFVNVWDDSGTAKVRKADATVAGKEAHGFVLADVASAATATVHLEGTNNQCSGLIPGRQFLSTTAGKCGNTAPSASGNVVQCLGFATSATAMSFQPNPPITLA